MGQRRKHVLQTVFSQDIQPPAETQQIVRAVGARGGNIIEVEYPSGSTTLCMMPARFNRKLWVRRGGYLVIEPSPEAEQDANSRVTGTICTVLYDEHIKQLKKMPGVWPPEFQATNQSTAATADADDFMPQTESEDGASELEEEPDQPEAGSSAAAGQQSRHSSQQQQQQQQDPCTCSTQDAAGTEAVTESGHRDRDAEPSNRQQLEESEDSSESDDDLPPLQQINNRRVVQYEVSDDSDSDEED